MSFVVIGKVHSPQGVRGQIFVHIFAGEAEWSDDWKTLSLAPQGELVPTKSFPIKLAKPHSKQNRWGFIVTIENIDNRNDIEDLKGLSVLIPENLLVAEEGEGLYLREVLGFAIEDTRRGSLGRVKGFSGNDFQDLLIIEHHSGEEFLVPFVDAFIVDLDKEARQITMDIPEGLVPGEEL